MDQAAKLAGNATRLAEKSGISRRAIGEYLAGKAEPSRPRLVAIAAAAGVRVEWLATGEGPMRVDDKSGPDDGVSSTNTTAQLDEALMNAVAEGIAEIYKAENARIYPLQLVQATSRMYADLVAAYDTPEERRIGLKGMLQQLRRDLRSPACGADTSKRLA
ncbi:MAG TPA: helix-turn-helix transcriptional regulator [Azospirillum sp.]|nr:helix-turn-helix transcriptional regulator [Azospirillum sp.]